MVEIDLFETIDKNQLTCPYCGSEEIYWYLIDLENSRNGIRCDDCKATWWKDIVGLYTQRGIDGKG